MKKDKMYWVQARYRGNLIDRGWVVLAMTISKARANELLAAYQKEEPDMDYRVVVR